MATGDGGLWEFISEARDSSVGDAEEIRAARKSARDERDTKTWQAESRATATRRGKRWTNEEIEILRMKNMTMREQARALGRTYLSIKTARAKFKREGIL